MVHVQKSTQNSLLAKTKYTHLYELTYLYVFKKYNIFLRCKKVIQTEAERRRREAGVKQSMEI